jgi:TatD DNase family protein
MPQSVEIAARLWWRPRTMTLIDTHAHLYLPAFDADRAEVIARARSEGVSAIFLPNIDTESIASMHELAEAHPNLCFPMMGLHPCSVDDQWPKTLREMEAFLGTRTYYGIGETGLDLYWDTTTLDIQRGALQMQAEWAKSMGLPLILHSREATEQTLETLEPLQDGRLRGIFHCFSGTVELAKRAIDLGFCLGIGGTLTYKKSELPELLPKVSRDALVLETDCPYLPPMPHRGKRNEPSYIRLVADKLAEVLNLTSEEVAQLTTSNARRIFALQEVR